MKTIEEVGLQLQDARTKQGIRLDELVDRTGLTAVTLRGLLTGRTDSRLSTVLALAHELGLELVLLPTVFSSSITAHQANTPQSLVSRAVRSAAAPSPSAAQTPGPYRAAGNVPPARASSVQSFVDRALGRSGGGQGADVDQSGRRTARKEDR